MPFYDLRCKACDKEHVIFASTEQKKERTIECPDCKTTDLETLFKGAPIYRPKEHIPKY